MKSAFLLASPRARAHLRRTRLRQRLQDFTEQPLIPSDRGYLQLAELLLSGVDSRALPEDEKADCLIA